MTRKPLISAGIVMGVGLGGFVDGILFHQILQLHGMVTARYPKESLANYQINMAWDGLFHAFTWIMAVAGLAMLWRAARRPDVPWTGRTYVGAMILGWGLFNLVEGALNHHLLHLHHVVEAEGESMWDWLFLASGILLMIVGGLMIRAASADAAPPATAIPGEA